MFLNLWLWKPWRLNPGHYYLLTVFLDPKEVATIPSSYNRCKNYMR